MGKISSVLPFLPEIALHVSRGVPVSEAWLAEVKRYEKDVLSRR